MQNIEASLLKLILDSKIKISVALKNVIQCAKQTVMLFISQLISILFTVVLMRKTVLHTNTKKLEQGTAS